MKNEFKLAILANIATATALLFLGGSGAVAQPTSPLSTTHVPLDERIAHADPAWCIKGKPGCLNKTPQPGPHDGAGTINWGPLFDAPNGRPNNTAKFNLGAPLGFLHRGELPPGASFWPAFPQQYRRNVHDSGGRGGFHHRWQNLAPERTHRRSSADGPFPRNLQRLRQNRSNDEYQHPFGHTGQWRHLQSRR